MNQSMMASQEPPMSQHNSKKFHILHVDNDTRILNLTKEFLKYFNQGQFSDTEIVLSSYQSTETANIDLAYHHYDLIITDYRVPDMNRVVFSTKLFNSSKTKPPFILLNSHTDQINQAFNNYDQEIDIYLELNSGAIFKFFKLILGIIHMKHDKQATSILKKHKNRHQQF